ncbi:hypothetical protein, partial [Galbibacter sp. PAP.153]|uniref:hypothetical protein n=1 Tax=Galbibacter sp. PAP.153 TaxID=3104623 RepID=UPI00300ADBFB
VCTGYGKTYNPANSELKVNFLTNKYNDVKATMENVTTTKAIFDRATGERYETFAGIRPLCTRITNSFKISGADKTLIRRVNSLNNKIQGKSSSKTENKESALSLTIKKKHNSTSEQSFRKLADHFSNCLEVIRQSEIYNPNEEDLKLVSLRELSDKLYHQNAEVKRTYNNYKTAMIERNKIMYNDERSMAQIAKEVKLYVKSLYGGHSAEYKQIGICNISIPKVNTL